MAIKTPKMDKSLLVHTITWYRNNLTLKSKSNTEGQVIKHVRVAPNMLIFNNAGVYVEAGLGNFQIYYQPGVSTALTPEGARFAIGDTIKWDQNPNVMIIKTIRPTWGDAGEIHHYEIWCD